MDHKKISMGVLSISNMLDLGFCVASRHILKLLHTVTTQYSFELNGPDLREIPQFTHAFNFYCLQRAYHIWRLVLSLTK